MIYITGSQEWYKNGQLHRDNNFPAKIPANSDDKSLEWYVDGECTGDTDNPPPNALWPGQLTKPARSQ